MKKIFLALFIFPIIAFGAETKRTVHIDGMTCPSCAGSVERQFKQIPQVVDIDINIRKGTAVVTIKDGLNLGEEQIKEAVHKAGYEVKSIEKSN